MNPGDVVVTHHGQIGILTEVRTTVRRGTRGAVVFAKNGTPYWYGLHLLRPATDTEKERYKS